MFRTWTGPVMTVVVRRLFVCATVVLALACAGPPAVTPTPSPDPASTPPQAPTATPTAVATRGPMATPDTVVTPSPPPLPTATPQQGWTEPLPLEGLGHEDVALVVAADGAVHAAASRGGAIVHLSNERGEWQAEQLTSPARRQLDNQPAVAVEADTVWIAFTRRSEEVLGQLPEAVYVVRRDGGQWVEAFGLVDRMENSPALAVRGGVVHLAYVEGAPFDVVEEGHTFPLHHLRVAGDAVVDERVDAVAADPRLRLGRDGRPWFVFAEPYGLTPASGLHLFVAEGSGYSGQPVPGTAEVERAFAFDLDELDRPHVAWSDFSIPGLMLSVHDGTAWSTAEVFDAGTAYAVALAIDDGGVVHVLAALIDEGVWYATNAGGDFVAAQLSTGHALALDMALDGRGRPHVMYVLDDDGGSLWYAVGPSR